MIRWSERWRALFVDADALRVSRGRVYQRSGRVTNLRTRPGELSARVQGERATPYLVEIGMPVLDEGEWGTVVSTVADQARHTARLLAGQAPEGLEDVLAERGVRLFPHPAELATSCACEDRSPVCKHVVAVLEAVARRLDADPFLLLHLRGRGRERFLSDLAAARNGAAPIELGLPVSALAGASWTEARRPLDTVTVPPPAGWTSLESLGDPPGWAGGVSAADLFGPLAARGAAWAAALLEKGD
jgi:uncharacterized Zn finger protein